MIDLLIKWSNINSFSLNLNGLALMLDELREEFIILGKRFPHLRLDIDELDLKPALLPDLQGKMQVKQLGKALRIRKLSSKPDAIRVLLMGHMDTVFPENSEFQTCTMLDDKHLNGPGVADLKGGLVIMLKALEALESSDFADNIAWEVFINPDEEISSLGSAELFPELAESNQLALIFEPALADGSLAYRRKGNGNFYFNFHGKSAHSGRDFASGVSAILSAAEFIKLANEMNSWSGVTVNFGKIIGGTGLNVVPDFASLGVNVRIMEPEQCSKVEAQFKQLVEQLQSQSVIKIESFGGFTRQPKIPNQKLENLYQAYQQCAQELGLTLNKKDSGGCCDGNNLMSLGLVNLDTLGVVGGKIHSSEEYMVLDSLVERSKLTAAFLLKLASKEFKL